MTRLDCRICGSYIIQLLPGRSIAQWQILLRISMTIRTDIGLKLPLRRMVALPLSTREMVLKKPIRNSWNGCADTNHQEHSAQAGIGNRHRYRKKGLKSSTHELSPEGLVLPRKKDGCPISRERSRGTAFVPPQPLQA